MKLCPCNSNLPYADCCGLLHTGGKIAPTAESLMRSRYTAYVVKDVDYLLRTWHPSTRPSGIDADTIPDWHTLQIIHTEKGMESDGHGIVEFRAMASSNKQILSLHEISRFVKEDGQWFYVDGDIVDDSPPGQVRSQKIGRNAPCPCGSGKKAKKCCGA